MTTPETTTPTRYLTTAEACRRLGVTRPTIIRWVEEGHLPCPGRTFGGHRRFNPADVDQLANQMRQTGRAEP